MDLYVSVDTLWNIFYYGIFVGLALGFITLGWMFISGTASLVKKIKAKSQKD